MFRDILLPILAAAPILGALFATPLKADAEPRVSGPHTHGNLSIYLVHGKSAAGPVPLTLDEALTKGAVEVGETGEVSRLTFENKSREPVFVHAGDIVKGGKQDRVVTASFILPPKSGKIDTAVYCVEAGRWAPRGREDAHKFAAAAEMMPSKDGRIAVMATASIAPRDPVDLPTADLSRETDASAVRRASRTQAPRNDDPANARGGQSEVWSKVAEIQDKLSAKLKSKVNSEQSQSSLQLALENDKLNAERDAYVKALQNAGTREDDVVGYAVAINGEIASADVYASNALFKKLWPRLLKAAATEAISAETASGFTAPTTSGVAVFLQQTDAKEEISKPVAGVSVSTRSTADAFDAETRADDGTLMHRAKLKR